MSSELQYLSYVINAIVIPLQVWTIKKLFDMEARLRALEERSEWLMKYVNGGGRK